MMMTKNQRIARARNWNKRMLTGAASQLQSMCTTPDRTQGLSNEEQKKIESASIDLLNILANWEKTI